MNAVVPSGVHVQGGEQDRQRRRRRVVLDALIVVVALAVLVVPFSEIANTRSRGLEVATRSFADQAGLSARFTSFYMTTTLSREQAVARSQFASGSTPSDVIQDEMATFGFTGGVIVTKDLTVVASTFTGLQSADGLAPTLQTNEFIAPHLVQIQGAVDGTGSVSDAAPNPVDGAAEVAFSVPITGPKGEVWGLSMSYELSATLLSTFLDGTFAKHTHRAYVVDTNGLLIAASPAPPGSTGSNVDTVAAANPLLADAVAAGRSTTYSTPSGEWTYTRAPIAGTTWFLLLAEPTSDVYNLIDYNLSAQTIALFVSYVVLVLFIVVVLFRFLERRDRLASLTDYLDVLSHTDALTGLSNRREIDERLTEGTRSALRPYAVLMVDIDHFKAVNDTHGHRVGDEVLRIVTERIGSGLRASDVVGRWGGEEFIALLGNTDRAEANEVAERIRTAVAATPVVVESGEEIPVTVSVGVASYDVDEEGTLDALVTEADGALYRAKAAGRDRVVVAG